MDAAYVHVLINHWPIVLTFLGLFAAIAAMVTRRRMVWLYAVATLTFGGVASIPVYLTGQRAEGVIEEMWWASHDQIETHEGAALTAFVILLAMGALTAYAWWQMVHEAPNRAAQPWLRPAVLVAALAGALSVAVAANLGGEIQHEAPGLEAPPAALPTPAGPSPTPVP
jgi:uncharacterized membrane protein